MEHSSLQTSLKLAYWLLHPRKLILISGSMPNQKAAKKIFMLDPHQTWNEWSICKLNTRSMQTCTQRPISLAYVNDVETLATNWQNSPPSSAFVVNPAISCPIRKEKTWCCEVKKSFVATQPHCSWSIWKYSPWSEF